MTDSQSDYHQELKALYELYAAALPDKIEAIKIDWNNLKAQKNEQTFKTLFRNVHSLVGSGATFGFLSVSEAARQLQQGLEKYHVPALSSSIAVTELDSLLDELDSAAYQPARVVDIDPPLPIAHTTDNTQELPLIYLLSNDEAFATELGLQLSNNAMRCRVFASEADLLMPIQQENPVAILIRTELSENPTTRIQKISTIVQAWHHCPLLYVISDKDDMETRLSAVRAGAAGYLLEPINLSELITALHTHLGKADTPPYRILIIDDDESVAHHNALVLQRAGMETVVITDPMLTLEPLMLFQPELILLDVNMPDCSGLELAAVIRQQCAYTGTAIVFFSVETDIDRHIDAMRIGGDEFFVKPMEPKRLVAAVEARAKRTRVLRAQMMRDGLTGVLNRSVFDHYLQREFSKSLRENKRFCYVLLDLDKFKNINDSYGHPAGDQVLKTLAALLTKRMRFIDVIGRYGGEEFAIILPNTDIEQAVILVNELLCGFSQHQFSVNNDKFHVTFSAGIAEFPAHNNLTLLTSAADQALYAAKEQGRNRVCMASR